MYNKFFGCDYHYSQEGDMKAEHQMTVDDLAAWYVNCSRRVHIANELGCKWPEYSVWNCCVAHQGLYNEYLHMRYVAERLQPDESNGAIFSVNWWLGLGQIEAAKAAF